ncbi:MAG: RnfABCDGE type electron transport complex subunit A [Firmicutes bacterium]|uniref:electron transport complex protein RnfA n=1 Tax=Kallipyga massiliensis TaxID=1472764 RepID=UPI0004B734CF|nr:RnfABCDGE type electron transport complex subunit A [Kallipyga massiliensis]MDD7732339.1 RnfABCDGE type electron transport complex subunit A [Bacillota bacterium]
MQNIPMIVFSTIFINNYVFAQFLGICPSIGVTNKVESALGMGMAVTFVVTFASAITWLIDTYLLQPNLIYLRTIAFILVIATLVQIVEMFLKKSAPGLYGALGIYLPLITTNCMVLGVALLNVQTGYGLIETIFSGLSAAIGFFMAIVLLAAIRERYDINDQIPKAFRNVPMAMITLGLMSIAFSGFSGMFG